MHDFPWQRKYVDVLMLPPAGEFHSFFVPPRGAVEHLNDVRFSHKCPEQHVSNRDPLLQNIIYKFTAFDGTLLKVALMSSCFSLFVLSRSSIVTLCCVIIEFMT